VPRRGRGRGRGGRPGRRGAAGAGASASATGGGGDDDDDDALLDGFGLSLSSGLSFSACGLLEPPTARPGLHGCGGRGGGALLLGSLAVPRLLHLPGVAAVVASARGARARPLLQLTRQVRAPGGSGGGSAAAGLSPTMAEAARLLRRAAGGAGAAVGDGRPGFEGAEADTLSAGDASAGPGWRSGAAAAGASRGGPAARGQRPGAPTTGEAAVRYCAASTARAAARGSTPGALPAGEVFYCLPRAMASAAGGSCRKGVRAREEGLDGDGSSGGGSNRGGGGEGGGAYDLVVVPRAAAEGRPHFVVTGGGVLDVTRCARAAGRARRGRMARRRARLAT
jgi:hypothetical protein